MKQKNKSSLRSEIKRVTAIIETTQSAYLRRDMEKYRKRLEKQLRFGNNKGSRAQQDD